MLAITPRKVQTILQESFFWVHYTDTCIESAGKSVVSVLTQGEAGSLGSAHFSRSESVAADGNRKRGY
jgi:hypothetical protein